MRSSRSYIVTEFESLVRESAYISQSKSDYTRIDEEDFDLLKQYLLENVKDEGKQLFKVIRFGIGPKGESIQLKNYVGMLELPNGTRFDILPKIYDKNNEALPAKRLKSVLLSMLSCLKDFPALELGNASLDLTNLTIYEIFIRIYLNKVFELTKLGLKSEYNEVTESLNTFHGRLDIKNQIKTNIIHEERFFVTHDEYTLSRPENRIIKSTILKLVRKSNDGDNVALGRRLLNLFADIEESKDPETDYAKISYDSGNSSYLGVIQWSMVFLRNKSFSIFGGGAKGQSLLFPMDRIFEQYVARQMERAIIAYNRKNGTSLKFASQEKTKYLFDIPKSFHIKPDLKINSSETIILDTKWKLLTDKKARDGISQGDMYQMYAYSKRYKASNVFLLYPLSPMSPKIAYTEYKTVDEDIPTNVSISFVDLDASSDFNRKTLLKLADESNPFYSFLSKTIQDKAMANDSSLMLI